MVSYRVLADVSNWLGEIHRLAEPDIELIGELERLGQQAFQQSQNDVHVVTGSLRGSGKTASDYTEGVFTFEIAYGDESPGFPHNPVNYADQEMARGGDHDFMRNIDPILLQWEDAMGNFFHGGIVHE